ncbi:MAG: PQQ-binding-like beta-propeller repeat protein [Gammaproteobacteria bacterium]|nr:PQQ-binding-like beta-propeller repeat protein [Gammaproteobacteria bacterium]
MPMQTHLTRILVAAWATVVWTIGLPTAAADQANDQALIAVPTDGWPTNGGNLYNQRYSPLTQITRDNVSQLKGVWQVNLGSGNGLRHSGEAQPLVHDGMAFIITGADDVFALNLATGATVWRYQADLPAAMTSVCCGWTSRGVGLGGGRIYVGQLDGQLKALDERSGVVLWAVQAERWQDGFSITSAPLYYDGLVIVGFAGGELGVRGRLKAFDASTGALIWTFHTIPGPGEFGHDSWQGENTLWQHGGASIWSTPAIDPELGLVYFSTGNAAANSNGGWRPGDNLFTSSIVALDVRTGAYRWHFQEVHHDIWDYDAPNPVLLFDLDLGDSRRQALAQAGKTGWLYVLDRRDGTPLIGIEERPVPLEPRQQSALTQPCPIGDAFVPQSLRIAPEGYRLANQGRIFTPSWTDPVPIVPGAGGGANWPPSAHDPSTGHTFVCASDRPFRYLASELAETPPAPGTPYMAGVALPGVLYDLGVLAAIDMHDNRLVWQQHLREPCFSGMTATAGGLLFVGRNDGRLTAIDNATGMKLWEFQTGAGMNAPVSVFEHQGTQNVLAYAAGNVLAGTTHGDSVWLFSLQGTIEPEQPVGVAPIPFLSGAPNLTTGREIFESACLTCHGVDGRGGHGGIDLINARDLAAAITVIVQGRNAMPGFGAVLQPEQLRDVAAYVTDFLAR